MKSLFTVHAGEYLTGAYIEEKFGKEELDAAFTGRAKNIVLSMVYYPKINSFRGSDELQFEIQYYQ